MSISPAPASPPAKSLPHDWIGAATIALTEKEAKHADFRGSLRAKQDRRIDVLDVYCSGCRRAYVDVADQPCAAKINNEHLIGGDQRERMKRKHVTLPAGATVVPGPRINRRGIDAVIRGEL